MYRRGTEMPHLYTASHDDMPHPMILLRILPIQNLSGNKTYIHMYNLIVKIVSYMLANNINLEEMSSVSM